MTGSGAVCATTNGTTWRPMWFAGNWVSTVQLERRRTGTSARPEVRRYYCLPILIPAVFHGRECSASSTECSSVSNVRVVQVELFVRCNLSTDAPRIFSASRQTSSLREKISRTIRLELFAASLDPPSGLVPCLPP